jgi:hypothetical protein
MRYFNSFVDSIDRDTLWPKLFIDERYCSLSSYQSHTPVVQQLQALKQLTKI